jgi:hypothetical protein
MPGGKEFQRVDIWGDGNDNNLKTFDAGLEDG